LIKISGDNSIEKQILQNENLRPLTFLRIPTTLIEEVKIIFQEKYGEDISIPEYEVVQWIELGLKIHKDGDNCKFCDGKLDYSDVKLKIAQYKENKKHKATEKLKQFREQLQNLLESIKIFEKESKTYSTNIGNEVDEFFTAITVNKSKVEFLITSCQSKIDHIENQENFDFKLLTGILEVIDESTTSINKIKSNQLLALRKKVNNLTTLVKGAIGLEIVKSTTIKEKLREVKLKDLRNKGQA